MTHSKKNSLLFGRAVQKIGKIAIEMTQSFQLQFKIHVHMYFGLSESIRRRPEAAFFMAFRFFKD